MAREIISSDIPKINRLLSTLLGTDSYTHLSRMGGLTNHTYHVTVDGSDYVVRLPGDGTEEMIVRSDEEISTRLACRLGIDAELLYFGPDGSKLTRMIPDAVTMSGPLLHEDAHIAQVAATFRRLHNCGEDTGVPFEVFDMAAGYERIITENNVPMYPDYPAIKQQVMTVKAETDRAFPAKKVPCHNDPLCENWVEGNGKMYLIDWEYAGMNDGMWDLADVSIEAGFGHREDMLLLQSYLGCAPDVPTQKHFLASKIYVDYLWTLWAKTRVPYDGQSMEDWAAQRYARLKGFLQEYTAL